MSVSDYTRTVEAPDSVTAQDVVKKGDRFIQHHPEARWPLFIEVTRVWRTGWVDIRCQTWAVQWTKRMPQGLGPLLDKDNEFRIEPMAWTERDVLDTVPTEAAA